MDARLVVLAARLRLDVAQGRFGKVSSTTTFAVPFHSQNFGLKGGCLFGGEFRVVALSAAAYAFARDVPLIVSAPLDLGRVTVSGISGHLLGLEARGHQSGSTFPSATPEFDIVE
jgi:hypothetical protein